MSESGPCPGGSHPLRFGDERCPQNLGYPDPESAIYEDATDRYFPDARDEVKAILILPRLRTCTLKIISVSKTVLGAELRETNRPSWISRPSDESP
jgi:hypothetical protein